MGRPSAAPEAVGRRALQGPGQGSGLGVGILLLLLLQAAHLEDLCSCPELVAFIPVGEEVNGLAYVVPGILDLKKKKAHCKVSGLGLRRKRSQLQSSHSVQGPRLQGLTLMDCPPGRAGVGLSCLPLSTSCPLCAH